ncbi:MAG: translation initiation factor [Nanoarchaeota archaeon]
MNNVCPKCGLVKELCVCETIAKEGQRIQLSVVKRKFGKMTTVVSGINAKDLDLKDVAKQIKSKLACGGTIKNGVIELQGDHRRKVKEELIKMGFESDTIDMQ